MPETANGMNELGFADDEINACLKRKGLLSIELEFTKKCNLRCLYCYSGAGEPAEDELDLNELKAVILQAKELGAKKIILLGGGEPLMFEGVAEIVKYIDSLGLEQALFTNGTLITAGTARLLFEKKVSVIVKSNSLKPEVQDMLAGVKGVFKGIRRGLRLLMEAGYPANGTVLGIQTIICRQNIDELLPMWIWAREEGIIPYFEIMTYQGRARENAALSVPVPEVRAVFDQLREVDRARFGITWDSRPTIAAFSCKRHLYSCLVNSRGYVQPCTGVDMPLGTVREKPLREILEGSPIIANLRNIYENIEGRCRTCAYGGECYGCRGNAYQITGNYLASDPTCWRCEKDADEDPACFCK